MKVGIFSDTHDNLPAMAKIVSLFNDANINHAIHCGDLVAPFAYRILENLQAKVTAVLGNNDGEKMGLQVMWAKLGSVTGCPREFELEGRQFILAHYFPDHIADALAKSGEYDVVVSGHTHQVVNRAHGDALVLNPGEGCGYLSGTCTCAILDTETLTAKIHEI